MKKSKLQKGVSLLLCCALALALFSAAAPVGKAAGNVIVVSGSERDNLRRAVAGAADGDTIRIQDVGTVDSASQGGARNSDPWVIDKALTITGGEILLGTGGIVLGADVTFDNVRFCISNPVRSAIMANGHKLTLKDVVKTQSSWDLHLFCGGPSGEGITPLGRGTLPAPGSRGEILIQGSTSLDNIYGGSVSTDGASNSFAGDAVITVDPSATGSMGKLYACGALETPVSDLWFDYVAGSAEVVPPVASPERYRTAGDVSVNLYGTVIRWADGNQGGGKQAAVSFASGSRNEASVSLINISGLSVNSGVLRPDTLTGDTMALSVADGASLRLNLLSELPVLGGFAGSAGESRLVLGQSQTLQVDGSVTGTAKVFIGGESLAGASTETLLKGHTYIFAPGSVGGDFVLAEADGENLHLLCNEGIWTAAGDAIEPKLSSLGVDGTVVFQNEDLGENVANPITIPLNPEFAENGASSPSMIDIPFTVKVNGVEASNAGNGEFVYDFTVGGARTRLSLYATLDDVGKDVLSLGAYDMESPAAPPPIDVPAGTYEITLTVPAEYTAQGREMTATTLLTSLPRPTGGESVPTVVEVLPPTAATGLVYTGSEQTGVAADANGFYTLRDNTGTDADDYTAVAVLNTPPLGASYTYQWKGGGTGEKQIPWTIGKAEGPAAPENLAAIAPLAQGEQGRLLGTSADMEYSASSDFSTASSCGDSETLVEPGTYYVRRKLPAGKSYDNYTVRYAGPLTVPAYTDPGSGGGTGGGAGGGGGSADVPPSPEDPEEPGDRPQEGTCLLDRFTDLVPGAWYHDGIQFCLEKGIMEGTGPAEFSPNGVTTRAQIVTILWRLEGEPEANSEGFTDTASGSWYSSAVDWAASLEIVGGYGDGRFGPNDPVTREQLAAILYRYGNVKGIDFTGSGDRPLDFLDAGKLSGWAKEPMCWMVENGVINGKGGKLLDPSGKAVRAQCAAMLQRFCEAVEIN